MSAELNLNPIDTFVDHPRFVPLDQHELVVDEARKAARERDALARRVRRLQRNVSQARRLVEQLELSRGSLGLLGNPEEDVTRMVKDLAQWVGRLASIVVVQGAEISATTRGRLRPDVSDVDEALTRVADQVPESLADQLWQSRDAFIAEVISAR